MSRKSVEYADVLYEHAVRPTSNRIIIFKTLAMMHHPATMKELAEATETVDKSILSRTLTLFREKGIVRMIEGGEGVMLYELCRTSKGDGGEHIHFLCTRCHRTYCLASTPVPHIDLPEGYVKRSVNCFVKGICSSCTYMMGLPMGQQPS